MNQRQNYLSEFYGRKYNSRQKYKNERMIRGKVENQ